MRAWLDSLGYQDYTVTPASEDASFRSYHRLQQAQQSWVVMDAPPEQEPCDQFIAVDEMLRDAGLSAPEIIHKNLDQGFLVLSDFGNTAYLDVLDEQSVDDLYGDALQSLKRMQDKIDCAGLPEYDEVLLVREMMLFHDWLLGEMFGIELNDVQLGLWQASMRILVDNALAQPQVFVHRDYHSRNLMVIGADNPGIIDFQDAVCGPVTYDLVSLLRDCYIAWPKPRVTGFIGRFYDSMPDQSVDLETFTRWLDLMGVQRHLKASGIFCRLKQRDGKQGYIKDIPRTFNYIAEACSSQPSLRPLGELIEELDLTKRIEEMA